MTPYQINATGAPPPPSAYALVQPKAIQEYRQKGVVGRGRPMALPVAARTRPFYTGEQAGEMAGLPTGFQFPGAPQGIDTGNVVSSFEDVEMVPVSPQNTIPIIETFGTTEHRIQEATSSDPLTAQEKDLLHKVKAVPGILKKPSHKVRTAPLQKGFKKMGGSETVREDTKNIVQLTYPVKEKPVMTFVPPKFDQVEEVQKASQKAIKDEQKGDVTMNFEPWEEQGYKKKRGEMGGEKRKVAHQRVGKRKAETEESGEKKKKKTGSDLTSLKLKYLERSEKKEEKPSLKRKAETERVTGGEKKRKTAGKSMKPTLKINVANLPPSRQSSVREAGVKAEAGAAAKGKQSGVLPTKASKQGKAASEKAVKDVKKRMK